MPISILGARNAIVKKQTGTPTSWRESTKKTRPFLKAVKGSGASREDAEVGLGREGRTDRIQGRGGI